jgi:hypothetical protein
MRTSRLPGLRELRAPLAAGYIWLITLWLLLHGDAEYFTPRFREGVRFSV